MHVAHNKSVHQGDTNILLSVLEQRDMEAGRVLFRRLSALCPVSLALANPTHVQSMAARDMTSLSLLARALNPPVSSDDLLLLNLRIDLNSFDAGVFPLASFCNHSCLPNAFGFIVDPEDQDEAVQSKRRTGYYFPSLTRLTLRSPIV